MRQIQKKRYRTDGLCKSSFFFFFLSENHCLITKTGVTDKVHISVSKKTGEEEREKEGEKQKQAQTEAEKWSQGIPEAT